MVHPRHIEVGLINKKMNPSLEYIVIIYILISEK